MLVAAFFVFLFIPRHGSSEPLPRMIIGRAISVHSALNWPTMTHGTPPRYVWPPFADETHPLRPNDLARLKATGFDTIRLTVGLGIFLSADAEQATELDEIVLDRLRRILNAGLNVILDFHPISQDLRYPPQSFTESPENPNAAALRQLEARMARLLSTLPHQRVALEILNEPATRAWDKPSASAWQLTQRSYFDAVRAAAPNLTIVLSGCCACCNLDLMMIQPSGYDDANTYYTFHLYAPLAFTHQMLKDPKRPVSVASLIGPIPFPIAGEELAEVERRARKNFAAADIPDMKLRAQIARDLDTSFKRLQTYGTTAGVEAIFDTQVEWAKKNNIAPQRLFLGEFGVQRPGVDPSSRRRWLETVRTASEKRGIPWAYWSLEAPQYMGLAVDKDYRHFDQLIIDALGLKQTGN